MPLTPEQILARCRAQAPAVLARAENTPQARRMVAQAQAANREYQAALREVEQQVDRLGREVADTSGMSLEEQLRARMRGQL